MIYFPRTLLAVDLDRMLRHIETFSDNEDRHYLIDEIGDYVELKSFDKKEVAKLAKKHGITEKKLIMSCLKWEPDTQEEIDREKEKNAGV